MNGRLDTFRERHGVAAIGCAVVDLDLGAEIAVAGTTRRDGGEPVDRSDAWHIGSCGKAITAALYATFVQRGRAAWGAALTELLPDLAPSTHPAWAAVTVDDLFVCRSGLPANPRRTALAAMYTDGRDAIDQRTATARTALAAAPDGHGRFRYSNLGYVVAGAVIDRVGGEPLEAALRRELLEPLGVAHAAFGPPPRIWGHRPRRQLGGVCIGRGAPVAPDDLRSDNPPLLTPAGRLHLTLDDWARVQRLFLDGGGVLSETSIEHLLRLPSDGRGMAMGWARARGLGDAAWGMQGSNTAWAAVALLRADRRRVAMVIVNDGRTRMLQATPRLAAELLATG